MILLGLLEPGAVTVARRVLRGPRGSNAPGLPDLESAQGGHTPLRSEEPVNEMHCQNKQLQGAFMLNHQMDVG
jgi:hypothetical protein